MLVIIGGFVYSFGRSVFFLILIIFFIFNFNNFILCTVFFLSFSLLHILLSCVAERILVLWLGVRSEPLRWESRVKDTGTPETTQHHVISISESSPTDFRLNAKTQLHSMTSKLQCWTPHAKLLARQENNTTH